MLQEISQKLHFSLEENQSDMWTEREVQHWVQVDLIDNDT